MTLPTTLPVDQGIPPADWILFFAAKRDWFSKISGT
jgi:hypothetical protein